MLPQTNRRVHPYWTVWICCVWRTSNLPRFSFKSNGIQLSYAGIVKVELDRPEVKNAIGKDMLKGLQDTLKSISEDPKANVLMICSSVPKVFCAGADLKVTDLLILFLAAIDENMLLMV